jgi:hypothetical protein
MSRVQMLRQIRSSSSSTAIAPAVDHCPLDSNAAAVDPIGSQQGPSHLHPQVLLLQPPKVMRHQPHHSKSKALERTQQPSTQDKVIQVEPGSHQPTCS